MRFISITCTNCDGNGMVTPEGGETYSLYLCKQECDECDGAGSTLVDIKTPRTPYEMDSDLVGTNEKRWTSIWFKPDDDAPADIVNMLK